MSLTPLKSSPPSLNSVLQSNPGDRVSAGKSDIAPVVAILSRQLPLPQAQQLAGQTALVRVVKGGPGNEAELEFAGQNIPVKLPPGRSLTAGEMVTVSFALRAQGDDLSAGGAGGTKKLADTRSLITTLPSAGDDPDVQESPSFVDRLSGSARLIGLLERLGKGSSPQVSTTVINSLKQLSERVGTLPSGLLQGSEASAGSAAHGSALANTGGNSGAGSQAGSAAQARALVQQNQALLQTTLSASSLAGALAEQVSAAVENSGLFYESHLQQWANGQRSTDQIVREPQARFGIDQVISERGVDPASLDQSVKMVTAQLATLDSNRISLALSGLLGQPVQIEIEPDTEEDKREGNQPSEEGVRPWVARLKLEMAHLGELQVRVRMIGSQCDVQMSGPAHSKQAIDRHWHSFRQAMDNQGLKLVHGQFMTGVGHEIGE
ncbi:MAG TPA: flagellar hook-length control protein FliK [Limnobacter sp.]|nr:flagellar hook-length control protein FliK [Limnobacter sp.]